MLLEFHPLADLFPLIDGKEFDDLVVDVKANGILDKIVMLEDKILDGRNRYRAGVASGLFEEDVNWRESWLFVEFGPDMADCSPEDYVISKNIHRRHQTPSQLALVGAELAKLSAGRRENTESKPPMGGISAEEAAEKTGASVRNIERARVVTDEGVPELVEKVKSGEVSVRAAEAVARLPREEQEDIVRNVDPAAFNAVAKERRDKKTEEKKQKRAENEAVKGQKQHSLPARKFGVLYMDPEWKFKPRSDAGMDRAADNHYRTSRLIDIMRRDIASIAAPDAVLFMWATAPMLIEAICTLDAYGFATLNRDAETGFLMPDKATGRYVSQIAWLKESIITGFWARGKHEILLIATRGSPVAPAMGTQLDSWIADEAAFVAKTDRHSAKPEIVAQWIEQHWPNTPKIELNRRGLPRPGWCAWGDEVEGDPAQGIIVDEDGFADASHLPLAAPKSQAKAADKAAPGARIARSAPQAKDKKPARPLCVRANADGLDVLAVFGDGTIKFYATTPGEPFPTEIGWFEAAFDGDPDPNNAPAEARAALTKALPPQDEWRLPTTIYEKGRVGPIPVSTTKVEA